MKRAGCWLNVCVLALLTGCASARSEHALMDGGDGRGDGGDTDGALLESAPDGGDSPDASEAAEDAAAGDADAGDAASESLAPVLEILSPRHVLEVYPGSSVLLRLRCEPAAGSSADDLSYSFSFGEPEQRVAGSEAVTTFAQVGEHAIEALCTDSRTGLSAQAGAIVRVLEPGYVVYGGYVSRIDDLAHRELLLPEPTAPAVTLRQARYALGGDVMVVASSTAGVDAVHAHYRLPQEHSIELGAGLSTFEVSPDGRYVLPIDTGSVELFDLQAGGAHSVVFTNSAAESFANPLFSADGARMAFTVEGEHAQAYVVEPSAPSALTPLAWAPATHIRATHVSERLVFAQLNYDATVAAELRAFDLQGHSSAVLAELGSFSAAYCGDHILVGDAAGEVTLWQDTPQGLRSVVIEALPMLNIRFSDDCSVLTYATEEQVSVLRLPEVSAPLGEPEVIVVDAAPFEGNRTVTLSAHGRYLAVREWQRPSMTLNVYDLAGAPELVMSLDDILEIGFAPDESRFAYHVAVANERLELHVRALGEPADDEVVYGLYRNPLSIWHPLSQAVALNIVAARNDDGTVSSASGLVEIDLSGTSEPSLLVEASRGSPTMSAPAQRVPGRRSVLFTATGELESESRIYARALGPSTESIEQITGPTPAWTVNPPVLSRSGVSFAVHQRSVSSDYFATVGLRTHDSDPHSLMSLSSEADYIASFGDLDGTLVLSGGGLLEYCDLEQSSTVELAPGLVEHAASGRGMFADRIGKLFFMAGAGPAGTHPLYVWSVGASEAVEIAPEVREFHVAPSGDWLVMRVRDGSVWLSDAARNWLEPRRIESSALVGAVPVVEFYENGFDEGAALRLDQGTILVRHDSTEAAHELSTPAAFTLSQDRAFFMHPDGSDGVWAIASVDLTIPDPEIVTHMRGIECQPIDAYTEQVWTNNLVSAHGRFFTAMCWSPTGNVQRVFDLERGQTRDEPSARSPELSFDRTGRFLGYPAFAEDGEPLGLRVLDLDDFEAPAIELAVDGLYMAPLWVD